MTGAPSARVEFARRRHERFEARVLPELVDLTRLASSRHAQPRHVGIQPIVELQESTGRTFARTLNARTKSRGRGLKGNELE